MTITLPAWILPTTVTFLSFAVAAFITRDSGRGGGYGAAFEGVIVLMVYAIALIASLTGWLIYLLAVK